MNVRSHSHPDPVQEFSQRVQEAWPLTLDPSPRAIHVSGPTARGEGRVRGHANSTVSGSLRQQSFNFQAVVFNERVAEKLVARLLELPAGDCLVAASQYNFQILADLH